jgi:hypothetical protein
MRHRMLDPRCVASTLGDEQAVQVFLLYIATRDETPPCGSQSGGGATRVTRATNEGLEGLSQDPGHHCLPPIRTVQPSRSDWRLLRRAH